MPGEVHDESRQSINVSTASTLGEGDNNVLESQLEVQTHELTLGECMLNIYLKCLLGLLWFLFCIFVKKCWLIYFI